MAETISELQRAAADAQIPVVSLLLRALTLANAIGDGDLYAWANRELQGCSEGDVGHEYRSLNGELAVLARDGRLIPFDWGDSDSAETRKFVGLPVAELESTMARRHSRIAVQIKTPTALSEYCDIAPGDKVVFSTSRATISGLLGAVRHRVLEWTITCQHVNEQNEAVSRTPNRGNLNLGPTMENIEPQLIAYLKDAYLQNPAQQPATKCPTIAQVMRDFELTKEQCYALAARMESLGYVEWRAKQADGEFLRIQPAIMNAPESTAFSSTDGQDRQPSIVSGRWTSDNSVRTIVEMLSQIGLKHMSIADALQHIIYRGEVSLDDMQMICRAARYPSDRIGPTLTQLVNAEAVEERTAVSPFDPRQTLRLWTMNVAQQMEYERAYPSPSIKTQSATGEMDIDSTKVFVVHGRNDQARIALFDFLRAIGLRPLEWSEIVHLTGKATPYVGDVIEKGFAVARAVVVLMTPDDKASLRGELRRPTDPAYESQIMFQPRPNVLIEAGMALSLFPDRTVIVQLGELRPMSDISGLHVVRMDNGVKCRHNLAARLRTAKCDVNTNGTDWYSAGNFDNV